MALKDKISYPKIKIKVIGIGGGGVSIVSDTSKDIKKIKVSLVDTDLKTLKRAEKNLSVFCLGKELTKGLGTGGDIELAKEIALKEKEKITKILRNEDLIIFVSCLGGGVGSGMTPIFAEISQKLGIKTIGFFTLPFRFEGEKKYENALFVFNRIKEFLNASLVIPNDNVFKAIKKMQESEKEKKPFDVSLRDSLFLINEILIKNLKELISIIYEPGVINVDFADLKTILASRGKLIFFNTVEAKGKNRAEETINSIFLNPLIDYNLEAERILYNISGSSDLKMQEIEKIGKRIAQANPKAKIIFGISKNLKYADKIKTTIIVVGEEKEKIKKEIKRKKVKKEKKVLGGKKQKTKKEKVKVKKVKEEKEREEGEKEEKKETKPIRKNAIEIKYEEEKKEAQRLAEEKELDIPSFLRKKLF
jgi:cell division protein FtsZ